MTENQQERTREQRIVDLLHEVGMLKLTPRSGYNFLGSGSESVAEHSHRTAIIGYVLARLCGADAAKTAMICLFHDLGEARVGDLNYVNQRYSRPEEEEAVADAVDGTGLEAEILEFWRAHDRGRQPDAAPEERLARDADQLDLLLNLKRLSDLGNPYAMKWFDATEQRLMSDEARSLAQIIRTTDHTDWWYLAAPRKWWINREK